MAHVLLPCDLPNWSDIQRHLAQLKMIKDSQHLIQGMAKIYDLCSVSLEPEEVSNEQKQPSDSLFEGLKTFLDEAFSDGDRDRFFIETLPRIVSQALCLWLSKPQKGFLYSLMKEEESFELDRAFVKSLLASAFFSSFPKRTPKTHPSLQNFSFCEFFQHLHRRSHQKKFKAFLRYFQRAEDSEKTQLRFTRKVLVEKSQPTLPGWLCSDRPLIPLVVRPDGNIHDAEINICRAFPCSSLIGGDVLQAATSPESSLFFAFPELLCCLCFAEKLGDNEAFLIRNVAPHGIRKNQPRLEDVSICLMPCLPLGNETDRQFEDKSLLKELNKALITFSSSRTDEKMTERRRTPVGESSSSGHTSVTSSKRTSAEFQEGDIKLTRSAIIAKAGESQNLETNKATHLPVITSVGVGHELAIELRNHHLATNDDSSRSEELSKFLPQVNFVSKSTEYSCGSFSSSAGSTKSLKTASESSVELPPICKKALYQRAGDDDYYTAEEDSDQCSENGQKKRRPRTSDIQDGSDIPSLLTVASILVGDKLIKTKPIIRDGPRQRLTADSQESSILNNGKHEFSWSLSDSRRSDSLGFVLGGVGSDEDIDDFALEDQEENGTPGVPIHEKLEDFRKRIRRRTRRHLSRKMRSSSRSSYSFGSSTSSDMEDISEEEDCSFHRHPHQVMRTSNSEPSLASIMDDIADSPPVMVTDKVVVNHSGRRVVVTSSTGQLKAYSYDGVNPNLPVPFRAKFRTKKTSDARHRISDSMLDDQWTDQGSGLGQERLKSTDSDDDSKQPTSSPELSSLSSFANQTHESYEDENIYRTQDGPKCSVAVGPSRQGDPQMRALILWLAASMAGLPSLIFYTGHEFQLYELNTVRRKVLGRQWTIGDLSCELLRFCRNTLSRRNSCPFSLFEQLLSSGVAPFTSSSLMFSQHSLD